LPRLGGYTGKVLRVDLNGRSHSVSDLEPEMPTLFLGGRGFNSKRLYDEVRPGTDPLGPENKVFISRAGTSPRS
jgi:aldehyde:ferredoxin oxidoreductase